MFGTDLFDECADLIKSWKPKQKYANELQYRDGLMDFLYAKLNNASNMFGQTRNIQIKKEDGRGLCDIAVGRKRVGIELKKDLKSKSDINRLQGQIDDYKEEYEEGIIVVLVGNANKFTETELKNKLNKKLDAYNGFGISQQFRIKLINKSWNQVQKSEKSPFDTDFLSPFG